MRRTQENMISPGSEPWTGLQHHQLLGDVWPVPFPPLTESPSVAAHLDCKLSLLCLHLGVTSETLLCFGPNLKEFPPLVCQTPQILQPRSMEHAATRPCGHAHSPNADLKAHKRTQMFMYCVYNPPDLYII